MTQRRIYKRKTQADLVEIQEIDHWKIRNLRVYRGLAAAFVAEGLEIPLYSYSRMELGLKPFPKNKLGKLCEILNVGKILLLKAQKEVFSFESNKF